MGRVPLISSPTRIPPEEEDGKPRVELLSQKSAVRRLRTRRPVRAGVQVRLTCVHKSSLAAHLSRFAWRKSRSSALRRVAFPRGEHLGHRPGLFSARGRGCVCHASGAPQSPCRRIERTGVRQLS
jgi:hypothetical protein